MLTSIPAPISFTSETPLKPARYGSIMNLRGGSSITVNRAETPFRKHLRVEYQTQLLTPASAARLRRVLESDLINKSVEFEDDLLTMSMFWSAKR